MFLLDLNTSLQTPLGPGTHQDIPFLEEEASEFAVILFKRTIALLCSWLSNVCQEDIATGKEFAVA